MQISCINYLKINLFENGYHPQIWFIQKFKGGSLKSLLYSRRHKLCEVICYNMKRSLNYESKSSHILIFDELLVAGVKINHFGLMKCFECPVTSSTIKTKGITFIILFSFHLLELSAKNSQAFIVQ